MRDGRAILPLIRPAIALLALLTIARAGWEPTYAKYLFTGREELSTMHPTIDRALPEYRLFLLRVRRSTPSGSSIGLVLPWRTVMPHLVPHQERIWIATAIAVVVAGPGFIKRERFLLITLAAQLLFCFSAYLVTPHDLKWHVATSWQRVTAQLTLVVAYAGIVAAAEVLGLRASVHEPFVKIARDSISEETVV